MSSTPMQVRVRDAWQTPANARTLATAMALKALKKEEIAERLRELRAQRGNPSQRTVAEEIKVGWRTYQSWELAAARPNHRHLEAVADYYGVTLEYILEGVLAADPAAEATQLDRIEALLHEILNRLDAGTGSPARTAPPDPPAIPPAAPTTKRAPGRRRSAGRG